MTNQGGLVRGLGLTAAISLNVANMIGTGVFLKARVMTCNVGSPEAVLAIWVAAGLLVLAGALSYAELGSMMPKAGGEYVFLGQAYGPRWGFLYGWTYLLVSRGGSLGAQAISTAIFFNIVSGGALSRGALVAAAITAIAIMALVNCLSVTATGKIASALAIIKVIIVAAVGVAAFLFAKGDWMNYALSNAGGACEGVADGARGGIAGIGAAMLGALWGYQGWANLAALTGEVRNPGKNIPRAFVGAMLVVGTLYVFAQAGYFYALTPTEIASVSVKSSVATEVLVRFMGPMAAGVMAAAMMVSSLGALHSGIAATARVPYAMAADGLFFRGLEKLSPTRHVPVRATILVSAWAAVLALSGSYDRLTDWAIFGLWLFYGLTVAAVIVLRRKQPAADRPYRVWGYPVVPIIFLCVTAWLLINAIWTAPQATGIGIGLILLGLPFYAYWSGKQKVKVEEPEPVIR